MEKRADLTYWKTNGVNGYTSNYTLDEVTHSAENAVMQRGVTWVNISGSVHDLSCSVSGWLIVHNVAGYVGPTIVPYQFWCYPKCTVAVTNHGHLTYATVENAGLIKAAAGGIVEHIVVHNTQSDVYNRDHDGLIIEAGGSGYHITLNGRYARAMIMGYAEDVRVYSGCVLDLVYTTAKVKNLTLYNGAYLRMTSGASVDGLVQYPGAVVDVANTPELSCSIVAEANCHEPDKIVELVGEISNIYATITSNGYTIETVQQFIKYYGETDYVTNLAYSTAMLVENATLVHSSAGDVNPPEVYVGDPQIYVYATDAPKGLIRVNTELLASLNAGDIPIESRAEAITSIYKYEDVKILNRYDAAMMTKNYVVSAPAGMFTDLRDNADTITWKVIF